MISEKCEFNVYIKPTKAIHSEASNIRGLTKSHTKLFENGIEVQTFPLAIAMQQLLQFLQRLKKKSVLVAHNSKFDDKFLLAAMKQTYLQTEFKKFITGITDSLGLFKKKIS